MVKKLISRIIDKFSKRTSCIDMDFSEEEVNQKGEFQIRLDTPDKDTSKIHIIPCNLNSEYDTKSIQNYLRKQNTVILINIKSKKNDLVELKRILNPIKKTVEAVDGDIAAINGEWIVATPNPISIDKTVLTKNGVEK